MALNTVDVALRDGATVTVRPLIAADEPELRRLLDGLSIESRTLRFFTAGANVHRAASYMAALTPDRGRGLVAVTGDPERIVAHAAYVREEPGRAEVAFEVADDWQGRGISTLLLAHLSELATADGIDTFTASGLRSSVTTSTLAALREARYRSSQESVSPESTMSSTTTTCRPATSRSRSLRMRTVPDEVVPCPYDETAMNSRSAAGPCRPSARAKSAMNITAPLSTQTSRSPSSTVV